jgi:hypothetical protein
MQEKLEHSDTSFIEEEPKKIVLEIDDTSKEEKKYNSPVKVKELLTSSPSIKESLKSPKGGVKSSQKKSSRKRVKVSEED